MFRLGHWCSDIHSSFYTPPYRSKAKRGMKRTNSAAKGLERRERELFGRQGGAGHQPLELSEYMATLIDMHDLRKRLRAAGVTAIAVGKLGSGSPRGTSSRASARQSPLPTS